MLIIHLSVGDTALHVAARTQNTAAIKLLLSSPFTNDRITNSHSDAPLHVAVSTLNPDIVKAFLENDKIEIPVKGKRGRTPLHLAAELDFVDGLKVINEIVLAQVATQGCQYAKFRLCAKDDDGVTPIHYAARCGSAAALDYMIGVCSGHGYPVEAVLHFLDEENSTPLHAAVAAGHVGVVEVLLKYGACPCVCKGDQIPSIHLAVARGSLPIVQLMVDKFGERILQVRDKLKSSLLHKAVFTINSEPLVTYLLKNGCDPNLTNEEGTTPLHLAAALGNEPAVRLLLTHGADPSMKNKNLQNALCVAAEKKKGSIIRLIFEHHSCQKQLCQIDKFNKNAVHYAVGGDDNALLVNMLEITGFKCSMDGHGNSILHAAASKGSTSMLNAVLQVPEALLYVNETNDLGATPLHIAARQGKIKCCEILLQHGAMVHKCHNGTTAFVQAAEAGNISVMKLLFEAHSFQKDWADDEGNNILHIGAKNNHPEVVAYGLDIGAAIIHNKEQESFLDIAINAQYSAVAKVAVGHKRWEECLDLHSPKYPFPMLALVECMPDIALMVLDKSKQTADCEPSSKKYYENYCFKYILNPSDSEQFLVTSPAQLWEDDHDKTFSAISETFNPLNIGGPKADNINTSASHPHLYILRSMCKHKRLQLITHPIVEMYLRTKWRYYGRAVNIISLFLYLIYLAFLTSLVPILMPVSELMTQSQSQSSTPMTGIDINSTLNNTGELPITISQKAGLLVPTIIFCLLNCFCWTLQRIFIYRSQAFTLSWDIISEFLAYACTLVFIVLLWFGLIKWEVGAFGLCFSWLSLIFRLQFYHVFGIYVFMIIEIFNTLLRVMLVALLFIIAYGMVMYVIAGNIPEYSSPFRAMFLCFAAALGEFEYSTFPMRDADGLLVYSVVTYVFVILLALMLTISVSNLLIGLAVGDIENCRKNAVFKRRHQEVQYYSGLDPLLSVFKCLQKYLVIYNRHLEPNARRNILRRVWRRVWHLFRTTDSYVDSTENNTFTAEAVDSLNREIALLKSQISDLVTMQAEQTKLMRGFARRMPRSSTLLDSDKLSDISSFDSVSFDSR